MKTTTKENFEDYQFLVGATVEEISKKIGKTIHQTIIKVDGVMTALRLIDHKGTRYFVY